MRKTLLIAMLAVVLLAAPAFASVQNIKLSGDITSQYVVRDQFDLGSSVTNDYDQNFFLTQTRLNVAADLTDNVQAVVGLINERAWGTEDENINGSASSQVGNTDVQLNVAYVTLREMLYSPLTVVVGRQNFKYGNSFIMDSAGTNNTIAGGTGLTGVANDLTVRRALDAVRLIFDYNPLTLEFFASKVDSNNAGGFNPNSDDVDLYGANATYKLGDKWDTTAEGYLFIKHDNSAAGTTTTGLKADSLYVPGLRASTNPIKGLNVQGEIAWQKGNKADVGVGASGGNDNVARDAIGGQFIANYMLPFEQIAQYSPVVTGVYTYVSGDKDPNNPGVTSNKGEHQSDWKACDPMFENQAGGTIYNSLFDLSNVHIALLSAQAKPMEDVTAKLSWTGIWLARQIDTPDPNQVANFTQRLPGTAAGTITQKVTSNKSAGFEIDGDVTYDYTEDVQLGLSAGSFYPGDLFFIADEAAHQVIGKAAVKF